MGCCESKPNEPKISCKDLIIKSSCISNCCMKNSKVNDDKHKTHHHHHKPKLPKLEINTL